jgi:hypothetical protein
VKGNFTFNFLGSDGFNYIVEGTSWLDGYLQFSAEPGVTPAVFSRANFKGQCSVQKVNPATGKTIATWTDYRFEAFTLDGELLTPTQADGYAIIVWDNNNQVWHQTGSRTSLVTLGSGDIKNKSK